jgi:hypothetical protein
MIWEHRYDTKQRMNAAQRGSRSQGSGRRRSDRQEAGNRCGWLRKGGARAVPGIANTMGLHGYVLPDMDEVADVAKDFYNNHLRGGEGHMEVGKLILNVSHKKSNMTLSVKPFGCMPSSGVSDGVQSFVTEKYPGAIFLPIETSGDGRSTCTAACR